MSDLEGTDEEIDALENLLEGKRKLPSFPLVSGWEKDTDGIEEEKHPHETPKKEILWAAENGDIELLESLLEEDSSLVQMTDKDGYTPLHRACYNNHFKIVKVLLAAGANVNAKTGDEWQPLHSACKWNSYESAAILLAHSADINALSKGGVTCLHLAASHSDASLLIQMLLSNPELSRTSAMDSSGDTPAQIARRSSRHYHLFEALEDCFLA